jgi:hypothetical protein
VRQPRACAQDQANQHYDVYVVMGEDKFVRGVSREKFSSGDLLFVSKGEVYRFEKNTPNIAVWFSFLKISYCFQ